MRVNYIMLNNDSINKINKMTFTINNLKGNLVDLEHEIEVKNEIIKGLEKQVKSLNVQLSKVNEEHLNE